MDLAQSGVPSKLDENAKQRTILIAGLMIAMLFGALDGTIVGTAMPRIVGELGGLSLMTWLTTAYMLSSTTVVPIAGKLSDLLGRRSVYVTGLFIFIASSALCGMAQNMTELILFRGMQGIGGGIMMPMAMIIIGDIFTGKQRAKWQGVFGALFGLSSVIGPQIGGWIVDASSWRWVFYINLPVGILATVLIALGLKSQRSSGPIRFDVKGMITMIAGVVSLLLALTFGGKDFAWTSWQIIGLFALSLVSLVSFIRIETNAAEPILPVHLFKNRTFAVINGIGFLMSIGMFGAIMFVPLFMQGVVGVSASASGLVMTPMMVTMVITSIIGGQFVQKLGVRRQMIIGMMVMACGFAFLTTMNIDTSKLIATSFMIVLGAGIGLVMPILTLALQESFSKSELGVVTSSSQFFRQIGGTFGITLLGALLNHQSSQWLSAKLDPLVKHLPTQASGMADQLSSMVQNNPQGLYSMLLSPEAMAKIPPVFAEKLLPILKASLVDSLHSVFVVALIFVILGATLTFFLGQIKLSDRKRMKEEES